jgi:hypothetical protein
VISFRYHLVSIVAVFLAIALGILIGATVVKQGVIDNLNSKATQAVQRSNELRAELSLWEKFGAQSRHILVGTELASQTFVIVTTQGVSLSSVDGVVGVVRDAGGSVSAIVSATAAIAANDPPSAQALAQLLSDPTGTPPSQLMADAGRAIAGRLINGPRADDDLLLNLTRAGFLSVRLQDVTRVADVGGANQAVIVLSGSTTSPVVPPLPLFIPMLETLAASNHPTAAGETLQSVSPFVIPARRDRRIDGSIVTVDDADTLPGQVALALGLHELLINKRGGDFGVKSGASSLLPGT